MIQGKVFRDAMISASNCLSNQKQAVDELNVFPVPDGDTGTNMSMTITAAARELSNLPDDASISKVADTASAALLRGARGNSGVILSLLFRGFAKGLKGKDEAGGKAFAKALTYGVEAAYKAVMKPTEGTILTVAREASEHANKLVETETDSIKVWEVICAEAHASLERTPELLPVLKKAGVVDAGGQGLCIIFDGILDVLKGGAIVESNDKNAKSPAATKAVKNAVADYDMDIIFPYCTEFIVIKDKAIKKDPLSLRAFLESIGDSVVVVDDEEIIKVHIHTDDPGKALSAGVKYGQFENIKVENMRIQHANAGWVPEDLPVVSIPKRVEPENEYGFVAVSAGEGLHQLFCNDLGCDIVVSGGQTMNPSTDDILNAIHATPAKHVFVLPNNKNIILAAEQAVALADRKVSVLQTRTIPQGIAAMLAFDESKSAEENLLNMMKEADNVSTGSITFAARDSEYGGKAIKEGEILALEDGKVSFSDTDMFNASVKLVKNIISSRKSKNKDINYMTLIYGEDVTEAEAEAVREGILAKIGSSYEISVVNGGQPIYYYLISVE